MTTGGKLLFVSEARVATEKAGRYANRLCKHFAHKIRAAWTPPEGLVEFPGLGTCRMTASPEELILRVEAPDAERLEKARRVVGAHLERFGKREGLAVGWADADGRGAGS